MRPSTELLRTTAPTPTAEQANKASALLLSVNNITSKIDKLVACAESEILLHGGHAQFWILYDGDRRVKACLTSGEYGPYWALDGEETQRYHRTFVPCSTDSIIQDQLGLHQAKKWHPARATKLLDLRSSNLNDYKVVVEATL